MADKTRTAHPNALQNYQKAVIQREKLELYVLNEKHTSDAVGKSSGKDKARVFKSALGFDHTNWELLKNRILDELPFYEARLGKEDGYGKRYNVILPITGLNGQVVNVLTAWIILQGTDYPTFTTALCQ